MQEIVQEEASRRLIARFSKMISDAEQRFVVAETERDFLAERLAKSEKESEEERENHRAEISALLEEIRSLQDADQPLTYPEDPR